MKEIIKLVANTNSYKDKKSFFIVGRYNICVVKKSSHKSHVLEVLGTLNLIDGFFTINVFRLVFWVGRGVALSGGAFLALEKNSVIN